MASDDGQTLEMTTKGLDKLVKALQDNAVTIKVGILGPKNVRTASAEKAGPSNATIGAAHEFGSATLPQRSFLRMPLSEKFPKKLEAAGALDPDVLNNALLTGSFAMWAEKIGILAVATVLEAFNTGGFGTWQKSNMARKKVKQTLVETHQLRDSISYEVK